MSPLYIGFIIAGVGLLFLVIGVVVRSKAGKILSTPLAKTGDAQRANGAVGVEGAARPAQQQLVAPCSGAPCVYYELKIEKKVKEKRGGNVQTSWKKLLDQHYGSVFAVDDGSGGVGINGTDRIDGDLEKTFTGPLPQNLTSLVPPGLMQAHGEEVLEYRVTERAIRTDARVFVMGSAQNGQITKGGGKLTVSTRGRDALVGSTKTKSIAFMGIGALALAGGATVSILRPGEARACGDLKDVSGKCAVTAHDFYEHDDVGADGKTKHVKRRVATVTWNVTQSAKYELAAEDPKHRSTLPVIEVENSLGLPMNIDLGFGFGAGAYSTKTTTRKLEPGKYAVHIYSEPNTSDTHVLDIHLAEKQ